MTAGPVTMREPLPNMEQRGIIHHVRQVVIHTTGAQDYTTGCGKTMRFHPRTHADTDAAVTCLACVAR